MELEREHDKLIDILSLSLAKNLPELTNYSLKNKITILSDELEST
jgi:hypothetical protein